MQLAAAANLRRLQFAPPAEEQLGNDEEEQAPPNPATSPVKGKFGRLTPVNEKSHKTLTQNGYKHMANYETNNGQGRFGYYQNPATGHKVTTDDQGNIQEQQDPQQQMQQNGRGGGGQRGGGGNNNSGGNRMQFDNALKGIPNRKVSMPNFGIKPVMKAKKKIKSKLS